MSDDKKQLTRSDTAFRMDRAEAIKFKLMPDGHIRAFQSNTPDLRGISELQIYPPPFMQSDNNGGALPETPDS